MPPPAASDDEEPEKSGVRVTWGSCHRSAAARASAAREGPSVHLVKAGVPFDLIEGDLSVKL